MSQGNPSTEHAASTQMSHLIINLLPYTLSLYAESGKVLLCQLPPSFSPVQISDFQQLMAPPDHCKRKYKEAGNILVAHPHEEVLVRVPVITLVTLIPRDLGVSGTLEGLPARIAPDVVYQPQWFISTEEVARLAAKLGRYDVLSWDPSTALFDEESGKGIQRLVQW